MSEQVSGNKDNGRGGGERGEAPGASIIALLKRNRTLIIFVVFLAVLPFWAAPISKPLGIDIIFVMRLVGVFTIIAVGLNLLLGYAGQVSLGQGAFFGIGAYTSALLVVKVGFPVWLGILAAVVLSSLFGLLVAPVLRLKGHYLAMATLGLGIIVFVLLRELTSLTGGNDGVRSIPDLAMPFYEVSGKRAEYFFVWGIAVIVLMLCSNLVRSRVGRAIQALHQSEVAAEAMGVNVSGEKIKVFVLSAALGGLAGGIYAHLQGYIDPNMFTVTLSISLLAMVVVGGMESIWGAVAGAGLITFLPKVVEAIPKWIGDAPRWIERYSNYEGLIFGMILILTMIFMPSGITRGLSDMVRYRSSPFINPFRKKAVE